MTTNDQSGEQDTKGFTTFDFISVWATATLCRFGLLAGTSCIAGVLPSWLQATLEWGLALFAKAGEGVLGKVINWGDSRYFWAIYFLNSLLYGVFFALVWRHYAQRGRRRGFPI